MSRGMVIEYFPVGSLMLFILPQVFFGGAAVPDRAVTGDPHGQRSAIGEKPVAPASSAPCSARTTPTSASTGWSTPSPACHLPSWRGELIMGELDRPDLPDDNASSSASSENSDRAEQSSRPEARGEGE